MLLNKKPIKYAELKTNTHQIMIEGERKLMWGDEMFDPIDSLAKKDFADEPVEAEAPQANFKGFR